MRNPNIEIQNKHEIGMTKKMDVITVSNFRHSDFGFVSSFGFRASDLDVALSL